MIRTKGKTWPFVLNSVIFDLIKGEMDYVKDLENIELVSQKRTSRVVA